MVDPFGVWFVTIRKDGTVLLPRELCWEPGNVLEIRSRCLDGIISMLHIRNQFIIDKRQIEQESSNTTLSNSREIAGAEGTGILKAQVEE